MCELYCMSELFTLLHLTHKTSLMLQTALPNFPVTMAAERKEEKKL